MRIVTGRDRQKVSLLLAAAKYVHAAGLSTTHVASVTSNVTGLVGHLTVIRARRCRGVLRR